MNKIAIQGHPTRGKEVIQILESLGGKNINKFIGTFKSFYFIDDKNEINDDLKENFPPNYKFYTLEEFEEEFPFKIGDKVITTLGHIGTIINIEDNKYEVFFKIDSALVNPKRLKPYKEMKEERNITLTLDKAKEWYKKGGELREVALQAYSKEELTKVELPKTWEEFCENYPKCSEEAFFNQGSFIYQQNTKNFRHVDIDKNVCPSKKSAEAHLALIQLEQLRDCYRQGDIPDFNDDNTKKYCIVKIKNDICVKTTYNTSSFLTFTKKEVAEEFLVNFEPLIKIAEDYI